MRAGLLIETFAYADALDLLLRSKFIYDTIGESKDLLEQAVYKEKTSQLETFIRQCTTSLNLD
jgi:type I site-specific restriction endonuclease